MGQTYTQPANTTSQPIEVGPNTVLTLTGSGSVRYSTDSLIDYTNNVAVFTDLFELEANGTFFVKRRMLIRLAANNLGSATLVVNQSQNEEYVPESTDGTFITSYCRFNLSGARDTSGNLIDLSGHGSGVKQGAGTVTETAGYFTTKDGTYGSGGTGRYYYVAQDQANFELDSYSAIYHFRIKKATPAGTEKILTVQNNSSTHNGIMIEAYSSGAARAYFRIGGTQNNLTQVTNILDDAEHAVTIVLDRELRQAMTYVDGHLEGTVTLSGSGTTTSAQQLNFGAAQNTGVDDGKFAQAQLYVFPRDISDVPLQQIVNKLYSERLAYITKDELGL